MTPFEEGLLFSALEAADAWRGLHDPEFAGRLRADELYSLMKATGCYSEEECQKAGTRRANERLDRELPP